MPGEFLGTGGEAGQFEGGAAANDEAATSEAATETGEQTAVTETDPFASLEGAVEGRKGGAGMLAVTVTALTLAPALFGLGGRLESSESEKPGKGPYWP